MESGVNFIAPVASPTWTTWFFTLPLGVGGELDTLL